MFLVRYNNKRIIIDSNMNMTLQVNDNDSFLRSCSI